jgi:hypothetical protein
MTRTVIFAIVCASSLGACHIRNLEDCEDDDWSEAGRPDRPDPPRGSGGSDSSSGGSGASSGADGSETGGSGSNGSGTGGSEGNPGPTACAEEADCPRGYNCDYESGVCAPSDAETCGELASEESCDNRNDCTTVYAGINCSCGPECACIGGEPGCVCESFAYFACEAAVE